MSLRRDFTMYYEGSVVGVQTENGIRPFYVFGCNCSESNRDPRNVMFRGELITDARGHTRETEVPFSQVVMELPEIGWIELDGRHFWVTYHKRKTVKKGIIPQRLDGITQNRFTRQAFWRFFYPEFEGRLSRDFALVNNEVLYKGYKIGDKTRTNIQLVPDASYLVARLSNLVNCPVVVTQGS